MNEDLRRIVKELEEANLVTSASVRRHEDRIQEHQKWLEDNELAYARHRIMLAEHAALMVSIDEKLERLSELILHGRGGNGNPV